MNTGMQTIEWLFSQRLKVDKEWAVQTHNGFIWWADKNKQEVEVIGQEVGPDGQTGYFISIRTELLRSVDLNERGLAAINFVLMLYASMAGPIYDPATRTVSLCSLVRVYDAISQWMNQLISVAAVLQIGEARIMGAVMAEELNAEEAISGHPQRGIRPEPDDMAEMISAVIAPEGKEPCRWPAQEFKSVVDQYGRQPPSLMATGSGAGFVVEFPYGEYSSLCQVMSNQPHPRYGNGLFLLQSFPVYGMSYEDGFKLALSLNQLELSQRPFGYGFGSYIYRDDSIYFTSFFPNLVYWPDLLPSIYFSCANRAREMSIRLKECDWKPESFSPRRSAIGRAMRLKEDDEFKNISDEANAMQSDAVCNHCGNKWKF